MRKLILISINAKEAEYLRSKGRGYDVKTANKSHKSRSKKYFMTTNFKSVELLNNYRKSLNRTDLCIKKNKRDFHF